MKILIVGGTGFIGTALVDYLKQKNHEMYVVAQNKPKISQEEVAYFQADLRDFNQIKPEWFEGVDAVVNLSGKNLFTFWTPKVKQELWDSRVKANENLVAVMATLKQKPNVFVSASAVGYYGDRGEEELTETSQKGPGFLAMLCQSWEDSAKKAHDLNIRVVSIRTSPVIGHGGVLNLLKLTLRYHFLFTVKPGEAWFPWVGLFDLVRIYELAITNQNIQGSINAVSPESIRIKDFIIQLAQQRSARIISLPLWLVRLVAGTARELLTSQKVIPKKLMQTDFEFQFPHLPEALKQNI